MRNFHLLFISFILVIVVQAQVAINTTGNTANPSAMLDVQSTSKGALLPRMNWTQIQLISNPAEGLLVFDTGIKAYRMYNGKSWVILGQKEYALSDPLGAFRIITPTGPGIGFGKDVVMASDGSVYVVGQFTSLLVLGGITIDATNTGSYDIFFARYDPDGNVAWAKKLNGSALEDPYDIELDAVGNVYICGQFGGTLDLDPGPALDNHTSAGQQDIFFAKYDGNGNFIWGKQIGGTGMDIAKAMTVDALGNFYVGGFFSAGPVDFNPGAGTNNLTAIGSFDIFFAKYDNAGNYIFANGIGSTGGDQVIAMEISAGNLIVAGVFMNTADFDPSVGILNFTSSGSYDIFFGKYDLSGNLLWVKTLGATDSDVVFGIALDVSDNIWLTGYSSDASTDMDFDPNAGVVILPNNGFNDAYIAKYAPTGNYIFAAYLGGPMAENGRKIHTDAADNVYVIGEFNSGADFDPSAQVVNLQAFGAYDIFIAKYNSVGTFQWAKSMGSTSNSDIANGIGVRSDGKLIFITGSIDQSPYMEFSGERINNSNKYYLARYEE